MSRNLIAPWRRIPRPPYADAIDCDGELLCVLGWKLGAAWPKNRFVIPPGAAPDVYDLRFVANRYVVVLHAVSHPAADIRRVVAALTSAGAIRVRCIVPLRRVK